LCFSHFSCLPIRFDTAFSSLPESAVRLWEGVSLLVLAPALFMIFFLFFRPTSSASDSAYHQPSRKSPDFLKSPMFFFCALTLSPKRSVIASDSASLLFRSAATFPSPLCSKTSFVQRSQFNLAISSSAYVACPSSHTYSVKQIRGSPLLSGRDTPPSPPAHSSLPRKCSLPRHFHFEPTRLKSLLLSPLPP